MKVYLLRHGETDCNRAGRYQGRLDTPLSEQGAAELRAADVSTDTVYVSPLLRARQTAEILFPAARQIVVEDFQEMDFGAFDGKSFRDMAHDPAYQAWVDSNCEGRCPGGEDKAGFCARTCAAFERLMDAASGDIFIVAHGGTQMALMERYAVPHKDYFSWHAPLGGGYVLSADQWRREHRLHLVDTVQYTKERL